jgi:hypothetical protein
VLLTLTSPAAKFFVAGLGFSEVPKMLSNWLKNDAIAVDSGIAEAISAFSPAMKPVMMLG